MSILNINLRKKDHGYLVRSKKEILNYLPEQAVPAPLWSAIFPVLTISMIPYGLIRSSIAAILLESPVHLDHQ